MANEEQTAVKFVDAVVDQCRVRGFKSVDMFVVLDRACKDKTLAFLTAYANEQPALRVIWAPENKSVVDAYLRGYREALAAGCDWILEIDAGFSHQPEDIPKFLDAMTQGYDCVFGSRFCRGGSVSDTPLKRKLISRGGTWLTNMFIGTKLRDMTSGFELFSRQALARVLARGVESRGPFFQTEIKCYCRNLQIAEVPIQYRGASHSINARALQDSMSNLWRLFSLRLQDRL
jgi:dolichol-phosphate mannosyltransferase